VPTDDILDFMTQITEGRKPQTKRIRFSPPDRLFCLVFMVIFEYLKT
jgi:hypothetical protein